MIPSLENRTILVFSTKREMEEFIETGDLHTLAKNCFFYKSPLEAKNGFVNNQKYCSILILVLKICI